MRDPSALPADIVLPSRPDKAKTLSGAMLALGAVLLFFVPVGGVFFLIAGGLGLTMTPGSSTQ